jgi:glycosyltransferase involved in cell wall biosynthesis
LRRACSMPPAMRVLHAISGINRENGGPPIVLHGLAAAQARAGMDVRVVATWTTDPCPGVVAELESKGVKVTHVGPAKNPMSRHPDTPRVLDELVRQADVVHVHAVWEQIQHLACVAARRHHVPYVLTPHGMLDPWNMSNGYWKKRLYLMWRMRRNLNGAAALHFATEMERGAVARLRLRPPAIVEPFGLEAAEFAELPAKGTFRARFPQVGDRRLVTFLGRLDYGKGLELLIPAFARVAREDAMLVVVGPDSHSGYRRTVQAMIDQHGLRDRVLLTGMLTGREKLAALVDAHVLAQPSFHENFGLAVVEALACGCPAIVSDQVYLWPRIKAAGVGGVVPLTVDAVAAELSSWINDDQRREQAATAAREFALREFSWDRVAENWVGHYGRVAQGA